MKKQILLTALLAATMGAHAQTAKVQVIHNCADLAADSVDVYLDNTLLLDNFAFRTATGFVDAPAAGTPITLGVAPKNSTGVADTFYSLTVTLDSTKKYIVVAQGIASTTGYTPSSSVVPFRLSVIDSARDVATVSTNTDLLVAHGSTDAPTVDVRAGNSVLVNDIAFGAFNSTGYLQLPTANYIIDVTDATGGTVVKRYSAPLSTLGLGGAAATVVASGFLDPSVNSGGKPFGLWVALASGGALVPLQEVARVQVINNSADLAADSVDVYLNGTLLLNNFAFRTATPFINAPVGVPVTLGVAPKTSASVADTFYSTTVTLSSAKRYIVVANGIESATGYTPSSTAAPFRLSVYDQGREISKFLADTTDVLVVHGCTDAPAVDVRAGSSVLVNDIAFGDFAAGGYLNLPTANYTLDVTDATGATTVKRYSAPLSTLSLDEDAITVVASGFLDPSVNSGGRPFGLWVALSVGGPLVPLPEVPLSVLPVAGVSGYNLYPNPATDAVYFSTANHSPAALVALYDMAGKQLAAFHQVAEARFDLSSLPAGIYVVKATTTQGTEAVGRIVKQ